MNISKSIISYLREHRSPEGLGISIKDIRDGNNLTSEQVSNAMHRELMKDNSPIIKIGHGCYEHIDNYREPTGQQPMTPDPEKEPKQETKPEPEPTSEAEGPAAGEEDEKTLNVNCGKHGRLIIATVIHREGECKYCVECIKELEDIIHKYELEKTAPTQTTVNFNENTNWISVIANISKSNFYRLSNAVDISRNKILMNQ